MQDELAATVLMLPQAQLYIVIAIVVAITAMTAADVREKENLLPRGFVNILAILLYLGSVVSLIGILISMLSLNDMSKLSTISAVEMWLHLVALHILLVALILFYASVSTHKEIDK